MRDPRVTKLSFDWKVRDVVNLRNGSKSNAFYTEKMVMVRTFGIFKVSCLQSKSCFHWNTFEKGILAYKLDIKFTLT